MPGSFHQFTQVADQIREARGKLEKTRLLAEFFRELDDADLPWACIYFTGAAFPRNSGRVVQAGFAQLQAGALAVSGAALEEWHAEYLRWSDVGDTIGVLLAGRPGTRDWSLAHFSRRVSAVADVPAGTAKALAVTELLRDLDADEARYAAKILTGDLRIGLKEGLVEDAIAAAFGLKAAEVRKAHQLVGDLGRVAVAARHGGIESLQVTLFTPLKPMLATAESTADGIAARVGEELWIEDKLDGIRAQAHVSPDRVALFSRDLKEVTGQFPEVVEALRMLPGTLILDGELMAHRAGTALPFFDLQKRLGRKDLNETVLRAVPVGYFMFDLLYQDGEPLLEHPFRERRARLEGLPQLAPLYATPLRIRPPTLLDEEWTIARSRANEGLMIKDPSSPYTPGRRGMSWLKFKKALDPLDVVVTGVEFGHGRRREVLSDYTFAVRDEETNELVNIGKAYSGLTDAEILELTEYFQANTVASYGRFRLVKPELVIEVAFEAIQESPRHKSGFALRFPRILRLRPDKGPADINTLRDVRERYAQYRSVYERES